MSQVEVDRPAGMRARELSMLCQLLEKQEARACLEIGMANASSTIAMLEVLAKKKGHTTDSARSAAYRLTSIDPFQNAPLKPQRAEDIPGFAGAGVRNVEKAGFADLHTLVEAPSYLGLPQLVAAGVKFDFIFIDGYHSFDFTFVDYFFCDLLLNDQGVLVFHDSSCAAVYAVCRFILHNKPYTLLSPPPEPVYTRVEQKILRRLRYLCSGKGEVFRQRREEWFSLVAYRKQASITCKEFEVVGL
jgi:predicted O-methyltransferase YrrM